MSATKDGDSGTGAGRDGDQAAVSRFVERFAAEMTEAGMQRMASASSPRCSPPTRAR